MNSGSFDQGVLNMTNWVGNGVMPLLAALMNRRDNLVVQ